MKVLIVATSKDRANKIAHDHDLHHWQWRWISHPAQLLRAHGNPILADTETRMRANLAEAESRGCDVYWVAP